MDEISTLRCSKLQIEQELGQAKEELKKSCGQLEEVEPFDVPQSMSDQEYDQSAGLSMLIRTIAPAD